MSNNGYFSFLVCKHGAKHFLYLNGLPIGYVEQAQFTPDTQTNVPTAGKMPPEIRFIGTGHSWASLIAMLSSISEGLDAYATAKADSEPPNDASQRNA